MWQQQQSSSIVVVVGDVAVPLPGMAVAIFRCYVVTSIVFPRTIVGGWRRTGGSGSGSGGGIVLLILRRSGRDRVDSVCVVGVSGGKGPPVIASLPHSPPPPHEPIHARGRGSVAHIAVTKLAITRVGGVAIATMSNIIAIMIAIDVSTIQAILTIVRQSLLVVGADDYQFVIVVFAAGVGRRR
jgi:hypothetical protein